jgi:uncharacterized cupin superfamily protein
VSRVSLSNADFEYDAGDPNGYSAGVARVGKAAGGKELAVKLFELPRGEAVCPYHYEYVEEWLLVLDGSVVVRVPDGEERLERGDLMSFAAGPAGAHKVVGGGEQTARVLMFSPSHEPAVAVYPDSDKIGVWVPGGADNAMLHRADGNVAYYDGES